MNENVSRNENARNAHDFRLSTSQRRLLESATNLQRHASCQYACCMLNQRISQYCPTLLENSLPGTGYCTFLQVLYSTFSLTVQKYTSCCYQVQYLVICTVVCDTASTCTDTVV
jgi:hypothetical protein